MTVRVLAMFAIVSGLLAGCPGDRGTTPTTTAKPSEGVEAATPTTALAVDRETCCAQCTAAASQDPTGADLSLVPCAEYATYVVNGERPLTDACAEWFAKSPLMVQDCR